MTILGFSGRIILGTQTYLVLESLLTNNIYLPSHTLIVQLVKNPLATQFNSWVGEIHWRKDRLPTPVFLGFPCGSAGKESARNAGDLGLIPGLGRSPGEGKGYPLQYSGLENSVDCTVRGVAKSQTRIFPPTQSWVQVPTPVCHFVSPSLSFLLCKG